MKSYKFHFIITLILSMYSGNILAKGGKVNDHEKAKLEIQKVISNYQSSILLKDEKKFEQLLHRDFISWLQTVPSQRNGKLPSEMGLITPKQGFYFYIFGTEDKYEEKISNIRIQSDDDVGSVFYSYKLLKNGEVIKNGSASWHLVRNFEGWKINSILSSNLEGKTINKKYALESQKEIDSVFLSGEMAYSNRDEATYYSHLLHPYVVYLPIDASRRNGELYTEQGNEAYVSVAAWGAWNQIDVLGVDLFPNQVITTDGEIASIYHQDREEYDGLGEVLKITGDQVTDYVRTPDGWKLVSKTFSVIKVNE